MSQKPKPVSKQLSAPASAEQIAKSSIRSQGSYLDAQQQRLAEQGVLKRKATRETVKPKVDNVSEPSQMMELVVSDDDDDY